MAENLTAAVAGVIARTDVPEDARQALASAIETPLQTDVWIYRIVVATLGMIVILTVAAAIVLALNRLALPDAIIAIGSTAVGALAGLLAPPPAA